MVCPWIKSVMYRDIDALPNILLNALSLDAGEGGLARMRHVSHGDPMPGRFDIFPR
jgi:transposase